MTMRPESMRSALRRGLLGLAAFSLVGAAAAAERSGKEVVTAVCAGCHAEGKDGAPRIGNSADWAPRAAQRNINALTANAIQGVRAMPAHGGQVTLTDLEMSRAVAYLVSGGRAADPKQPYALPDAISGEAIVSLRCGTCHSEGREGAPRLGDLAAWSPRLQRGVDDLVRKAVQGHPHMPARGGLTSLSDAEIRAAVSYMVSKISASAAKQ